MSENKCPVNSVFLESMDGCINKWVLLAFCIILVQVVGGIGALITYDDINVWYKALEKPSWTPPNWAFAPVWLTLYTLIGISLYWVIVKNTEKKKYVAYLVFGVQLSLNLLWSLVFFGMHDLYLGLVIILALLASIVLNIIAFAVIDLKSGLIQIPYLVWVAIATMLNYTVWSLN